MSSPTEFVAGTEQPIQLRWLALVNRAIVIRATVVAIVIGSILTLVNQSGWIAGNEPPQVLQLILVFLLPFSVVTVSQIVGVRQARIDSVVHENPEGFINTVVSHGIPAKAVAIGLFFGSVNAVLTMANAFFNGGNLEAVSIAPLGQAYVLPLFFAFLSQAISYRRARYQAVTG